MTAPKFGVTLAGPAKIDGIREPPGKTVSVSYAVALQLAASGTINPDAVSAAVEAHLANLAAEIEPRLRGEIGDELAAALAEVASISESLAAEVNDRAELETKLAAAADMIAKLTADLKAEAEARVDLEQQLATAKAAATTTDTPKAGKKPAATKD